MIGGFDTGFAYSTTDFRKNIMPVKIPNTLPARATLERENIFIMDEDRASHQDIRALRVAIARERCSIQVGSEQRVALAHQRRAVGLGGSRTWAG